MLRWKGRDPARAFGTSLTVLMIADHRGEKSSDWVERFSLDLADADRLFLVATIADEVVGFGQARLIEGAADSTESPPAGWYLSGMTVPASVRRQGIGGALIEARLQLMAQRTSTVHYLADPANPATISLHAKFGFTLTHLWPSVPRGRSRPSRWR
jgi:ribosomal protein S18 acetylase RimI-like enzyme